MKPTSALTSHGDRRNEWLHVDQEQTKIVLSKIIISHANTTPNWGIIINHTQNEFLAHVSQHGPATLSMFVWHWNFTLGGLVFLWFHGKVVWISLSLRNDIQWNLRKKYSFYLIIRKKVLQLAKYRKVTAMHRTSESSFVESVLHKCVVKVYLAQLATPVQSGVSMYLNKSMVKSRTKRLFRDY